MKSYTLNFAGTGATSEIFAKDDQDAISQATLVIGGDPVVCDQWDSDGINDDDQPCKRLLIWASEEDADNDDGANAVAELSTVGRA